MEDEDGRDGRLEEVRSKKTTTSSHQKRGARAGQKTANRFR